MKDLTLLLKENLNLRKLCTNSHFLVQKKTSMRTNLDVFVLFFFSPHFLQGVKPASYNKVKDPEIKEIIGECICQKKEERWVYTSALVQSKAFRIHEVPPHLSCLVSAALPYCCGTDSWALGCNAVSLSAGCPGCLLQALCRDQGALN